MRRNTAVLFVVGFVLLRHAPAQAQSAILQPASARPAAEAPRKEPPLFRHADVRRAWHAVQTTGRPLLVYVTADDCKFCKKMVRETFAHPQIKQSVVDYSEPVTFNANRSPELAKELGVKAFPTTLLISRDRELLGRIEGFVPPQEFADRVWPLLRRTSSQQASLDATADAVR